MFLVALWNLAPPAPRVSDRQQAWGIDLDSEPGAISGALDKAAANLRQPPSQTQSEEDLSPAEAGVKAAVIIGVVLVASLALVGRTHVDAVPPRQFLEPDG